MLRFTYSILAIFLVCPLSLFAQTPTKSGEPFDQLGKTLKPILIAAMPETLYEKVDNWGHQAVVPVGLNWHGLSAHVSKSLRNDGKWKRMKIATRDLPHTMNLKIADVKAVGADKQTFKVFLTFQMGVEYEQQNWESGVRLWSGSVRARAQIKIDLDCENTLRFEIGKNALPDVILRLRVTGANVHYDNLVVEHINGVGGDAAKLVGDAVHRNMNRWRPSIERDLLAKASGAIVKAADTREIRLGFGGLLKAK